MTPAQLKGLRVGMRVAIVRDHLIQKHRGYAQRTWVAELSPTEVTISYDRHKISRRRIFSRTTGRGLGASACFWLEEVDSIAVLSELQPGLLPFDPCEVLLQFQRGPEWAQIKALQSLMDWASHLGKHRGRTHPEEALWYAGEVNRLYGVIRRRKSAHRKAAYKKPAEGES